MRVSVVMPSLNEKDTISQSIYSLKMQSTPPDEIIVVDGGSTDGTIELAKLIGAKVIVKDGLKEFPSRHLGVMEATGDIVIQTGSDCVWRDETLLYRIKREYEQDSNLIALVGWGMPYNAPLWAMVEYPIYYLLLKLFYVLGLTKVSTTNLSSFRKEAYLKTKGYEDVVNGDGILTMALAKLGKVKFALCLTVDISPRRVKKMGVVGFNKLFFYCLGVFLNPFGFKRFFDKQLDKAYYKHHIAKEGRIN